MSSDAEAVEVTPEECDRWIKRLYRMAKAMEERGDSDGVKMLFFAAFCAKQVGEEAREAALLGEFANPFGTKVGSA
ncbi:hypothetical protein [Myxococcus phage Mx1]|nr:hypothetical protein [Myxococcus phage Mx1]